MIGNRIVFKLGGTIILLFLIVLLPVGFVIERIFSGFYFNEVRDQNEQLSVHYANVLATAPNANIIPMMEMMAGFSQVKLYIVDSRGQIIAISGVPDLIKGESIPVEESATLSQGKTIEKVYVESATEKRYLVFGTPIVSRGGVLGGVYVMSSLEGIDQSLQKVREMLTLAGLGAFFLALGVTYILSRKLSNPLIQMEKAARKIAKGDLNTRVKLTSTDEIGSLAQAINDLAFDLQRYRDTRKEFFANISHELRTPITYVEGYAKVLKDKLYESEEEKDKYLDIIHTESIRLSRMIGDLFDLSKIDEGKISLQLEWIDVTEVMEGAIQKTTIQAKKKGLNVQLNVQDKLPLVYCDGSRMTQIFINLLDNAIRYTDKGGIFVEMWEEDLQIKIAMKDTGMGIPEKELPYIFDRFYRVEKSRSRQFGGTGLGLAIVKDLVELQGGNILVSSILGKGTRFELTFPTTSETSIGEDEE